MAKSSPFAAFAMILEIIYTSPRQKVDLFCIAIDR
jgi:hypothetical protein